jgi:cell division protease FtsH
LNRVFKNMAVYLLLVLIVVSVLRMGTPPPEEKIELNYTQFYEAVEEQRVETAVFIPADKIYQVEGKLKNGDGFVATIPAK